MTATKDIGVDWCNGCWLVVAYEDGDFQQVVLLDDIAELWERYADVARRVLVDVPIGLFEEGDRDDGELARECDRKARKILGSRHSSIFNPPARDVLKDATAGDDYRSVSTRNQEITGKGLQQQAYHIAPSIRAVDEFLRNADDSEATDVVAEAHPEVCFAALADGPMNHSKRSVSGFHERLEAMDGVEGDAWETFQTVCSRIADEPETDVDVDDALDAMVLAITACAADEKLHRLPGEDPPIDGANLPMQMVYRAEKPFPRTADPA